MFYMLPMTVKLKPFNNLCIIMLAPKMTMGFIQWRKKVRGPPGTDCRFAVFPRPQSPAPVRASGELTAKTQAFCCILET